MHGNVVTTVGFIGSLIACGLGAWNSKAVAIPVPKGAISASAPVFDCGYAITSHKAKERWFSVTEWGIEITCTIANVKASRDARLRCTLPFAGAVYSREELISLDRGKQKTVVFSFPEPDVVSEFLESLTSNDPHVGYSFQMEVLPWNGWGTLKWLGGGAHRDISYGTCRPHLCLPFRICASRH